MLALAEVCPRTARILAIAATVGRFSRTVRDGSGEPSYVGADATTYRANSGTFAVELPSWIAKCGVMKHRSRYLVWAFTVLSASAVAVGVGCLWRFENTPGPSPSPTREWPDASRVHLASDRFTLVLFAHPHCPCTRATI